MVRRRRARQHQWRELRRGSRQRPRRYAKLPSWRIFARTCPTMSPC